MDDLYLVQDHPVSSLYDPNEWCEPGPEIEPGQIWLVECLPASLPAVHAGLLTQANVVLYESGLAAAVANSLPLGGYAEKLQAVAASGPIIAPRAVQFAADGWSVVQLVEQLAGWHQRLCATAETFDNPEAGAPSLLAIGTIAAGRLRQRRAPHRPTGAELATVAARLGADELLNLIFVAPRMLSETSLGTPPSPRLPPDQTFTANGLAG